MGNLRIALIGLGTVGQGVYQAIDTHQERLEKLLGKHVEIVGVLVHNPTKKRNISSNAILTQDIDELLTINELDVVVEAIVGVEPGYTYLMKALEKGIHVITANKELLAHRGKELRERARENNVRLQYEAAVAGGIPVISTLKHILRVNSVIKIDAILNGTSNYILSDIRQNQTSFTESLLAAQAKGYAEADPTNDIDGWDAFYKLMILCDLLFGEQPDWNKVVRDGIRQMDTIDHAAAKSIEHRIKLVASIEVKQNSVTASVKPLLVSNEHPLYSVEGVDNAVVITGDLVGELKLQGPGAGAYPTASAIVEDLVSIYTANEIPTLVNDVSYSYQEASDIQEWLLIGSLESNRGINVIEKWFVSESSKKINCWRVVAEGKQIRTILENQPNLVGYRFIDSQLRPLVSAK
ncbi:homoserine dehydrogenase [Aquibacillus kalidii]|uniref:homoserine dehydrogenase n=1 Tax=Aquibacillus kalidii TaxID=2762597 RepID=UPI0016465ECE|nr:homoserine dehydrogenase [Aquibacillus kalidii]